MSDVITLANQIAAEKENIRQAIEDRGVSIPVTTPLTDYAAKIMAIDTENVATDVYFKGDQSDTGANILLAGNYGTIADNAFSELSTLETVDLNYVSVIGPEAFSHTPNLTSVTGDHLKYVGYDAFRNSSLSSFENTHVNFIGNNAFQNTLVSTVSIPNCRVVHGSAFMQCPDLETVNMNSAEIIPGRCFYECSILNSVSANTATVIGPYAFCRAGNGAYSTYSTKYSLSFPEVTSVGHYSFYDCNGLETITLPKCTNIGEYAFNECNNLQTISIPSTISIGQYAFDGPNSISNLYIPNCESIGYENFYNNTHKLGTVTIADGCAIGDYCFRYGIDTLVGKPGSIGSNTFSEMPNITMDIDLSEVTSIGENSFNMQYNNTFNIVGGVLDLANCTTFRSNSNKSFYDNFQNTNVTKIWIRGDATFTSSAYHRDSWFNIFNKAVVHVYTDAASRPDNWGTEVLKYATWHFGVTHEEFENA